MRYRAALVLPLLIGCAGPAERATQLEQNLLGRPVHHLQACAGPADSVRPEGVVYRSTRTDVMSGQSFELGGMRLGTSLGRTVLHRECTALLEVQDGIITRLRYSGTGAPNEAVPVSLCVQRLRGCL